MVTESIYIFLLLIIYLKGVDVNIQYFTYFILMFFFKSGLFQQFIFLLLKDIIINGFSH